MTSDHTDSPRLGQHGVALKVENVGILITGKPGIGKSALALELMAQGHQLVADDHVELSVLSRQLIAHCPERISGMLHSRELGMIDVRKLYPKNPWLPQTVVDMIIDLQQASSSTLHYQGNWQLTEMMHLQIPSVALSVSCSTPLSARVLTAVKLLPLRQSELHAAKPLATAR